MKYPEIIVAVAEVSSEDWGTTAEAAINYELENLWDDLETAHQCAINGRWSIKCENVVQRIVGLSRIVGATHWENIPIALLQNGIYAAVYDAAHINYERPEPLESV